MAFSSKQVKALRRKADEHFIRTRQVHGRELTYLEGWYVISAANRIFGFDGWSRETTETRCVLARETRGSFLAVYTAKVRITVVANGHCVVREGHGTGEGRGSTPGEAHDTGLKAAETDATKRALITFGRPFGLELYRSDRKQPDSRPAMDLPAAEAPLVADVPLPPVPEPAMGHPDDTTPIPRPSTYYGRDAFHHTRPARQALMHAIEGRREPAAHDTPQRSFPLAKEQRLRDKAHLKFVASQPCLACGREPSDPHHLRFAQPRALGMKVSDEFTVPLCRSHHRNLHQVGNEQTWWATLHIEPLPIARRLWETTHPHVASEQSDATREGSSIVAM